jgi:hypothetical protein
MESTLSPLSLEQEEATAALGGALQPSIRAAPSLLWQEGAEGAHGTALEAVRGLLEGLLLQGSIMAPTLEEEEGLRLV